MTEKPKISVVIPARNEEEYIARTLKCLFDQDFKGGFEVIVVDHASADKTRQIAEKMGAEIVSADPSFNIAQVRQEGAKRAHGEIVASTDSDTIVPKDWLAKIYKEFQKDKNTVCVYGSTRACDGNIFDKFLFHYGFTLFLRISKVLGTDNMSGYNFAFRKDAFNKVGGYNLKGKSAEEIILGKKLKKVGRIRLVPSIYVFTSSRRAKREGYLRFLFYHARNYARVNILHKKPLDFKAMKEK